MTGTNGKTTTTYFLRSVLEAHGWPTSVIGTLGGRAHHSRGARAAACARRTRGTRGSRAAALEVSSHALAQHRLDGYRHDVAVFTNLSQDHLDYHLTMEAYFAAKAQLFTPEHANKAVVNGDDPFGRRLLETAAIPMSVSARTKPKSSRSASARAASASTGEPVRIRPGGEINVANALAAAAAARAARRAPGDHRRRPLGRHRSLRPPRGGAQRHRCHDRRGLRPYSSRASRRSSTPRAPRPGRVAGG